MKSLPIEQRSRVRAKDFVLVALLLVLPFMFRLNDLVNFDEMQFLLDAERMIRGEALYRDLVQVLDPMTHWITAALLSVSDANFPFVRLAHAILLTTIATCAFFVLRRQGLNLLLAFSIASAMSASQLAFFSISHHLTNLLLTLGLFLLLASALSSRETPWLWFMIGGLSMLCPFAHIVKGTAAVAFVFLGLLARCWAFVPSGEPRHLQRRQFACACAGAVLGIVMVLALIHISSGLDHWWKEAILGKQQYRETNLFGWPLFQSSLTRRTWSEILSRPAWVLIFLQQQFHYCLPFVLTLLLLWSIKCNGKSWMLKDWRAIVAFACLGQTIGMMYHCAPFKFLSVVPVMHFGIGVLLTGPEYASLRRGKLLRLLCVFVLLLTAKNYAGAFLDWKKGNAPIVATRLGRLCLPSKAMHASILQLDRYLKGNDIRKAFCYPNIGCVYLWCDLQNPTSYSAMYATVHGQRDVDRIRREMSEHAAHHVIVSLDEGEYVQAMDDWLQSSFDTVYENPSLRVLKLR